MPSRSASARATPRSIAIPSSCTRCSFRRARIWRFPCFDQPNLKARFALELNIPTEWQAVSNGAGDFPRSRRRSCAHPLRRNSAHSDISVRLRRRANFRWKRPSAMAAGSGCFIARRMRRRWSAIRDAVFDLHASSLDWLEKYTGIPYRFGKFDFRSDSVVSVRRHGASRARSSTTPHPILLDESATENQMLNRASDDRARDLAHVVRRSRHHAVVQRCVDERGVRQLHGREDRQSGISRTSITICVFSCRIIPPPMPSTAPPERIRSGRSLPIWTKREASTATSFIEKAPIVMRQLERILGPGQISGRAARLFEAVPVRQCDVAGSHQDSRHRSDTDLNSWSHAWVEEAGRPSIRTVIQDPNGAFVQSDPQPGRSLQWTEQLDVARG